ncbi:MAG: hypothetical protein JRF08_04495 [Deltaproteobacteria bacterium]|nr:hypothetical protein [Deltaproteobacteria bacterium]MBW2106703.1 hypothetical protein [Deltaproteobacteria bacterium]MBW2332716.1 hypothetical protein [Deltaproteobacteria bacterium]RLB22737.1 MAG: hypothetical protein DRG73_06425 [Deltaproteobacteria bacterium]
MPRPLIDRLTDEGRTIVALREKSGAQKLVLIRKDKSEITTKEVMDVLFVAMVKDERLKA